jgi:hypothetical protein
VAGEASQRKDQWHRSNTAPIRYATWHIVPTYPSGQQEHIAGFETEARSFECGEACNAGHRCEDAHDSPSVASRALTRMEVQADRNIGAV